jgi:alkyl hydroperoxide reductase subunit F
VLQRKLASLPNVRIVTSALTTEVHGDGSKVTGLTYKDRNQRRAASARAGRHLRPDRARAQHRVAQGRCRAHQPRGEIEVDYRGETSMPGVFAAGDATTTPYKQIVIAMGEGSKAALSRLRLPDPAGAAGAG